MDKKTLRRLAIDFYLDGEILYERSFDGTLLRCLNATYARKALREVHEGICSTHASGHMIARKIQRAGYFWMTLEKDCIDYVRKCHECQVYSDKVTTPPAPLFNLTSPWPFAMWGIAPLFNLAMGIDSSSWLLTTSQNGWKLICMPM
jgi:hypothetical protein